MKSELNDCSQAAVFRITKITTPLQPPVHHLESTEQAAPVETDTQHEYTEHGFGSAQEHGCPITQNLGNALALLELTLRDPFSPQSSRLCSMNGPHPCLTPYMLMRWS